MAVTKIVTITQLNLLKSITGEVQSVDFDVARVSFHRTWTDSDTGQILENDGYRDVTLTAAQITTVRNFLVALQSKL